MRKAERQPGDFWGKLAETEIHWFKKVDLRFRFSASERPLVHRRHHQRLL